MEPQTSNSPIAPQQKPSITKKGAGALPIYAFLALSLVMAGAAFGLSVQKADKAQSITQKEAIDKRLKVLEDADKFSEKEVDKGRYQAVFLVGGQVYFGKITTVTKDTMKLEDVYYLKTGTVDKAGNPAPGTDVSLVKLGKELHAPDDAMIIERKNVSFWENLKAEGQVSKAIATYKQQ